MIVRGRLDCSLFEAFKGLKHYQLKLDPIDFMGSNSLASLSVRSSFHALLLALDLESGDEIIFSSLTIPDMPKIARHHGLVPVAANIKSDSLSISAQELTKLITKRTKIIVIAHLFGLKSDCSEIAHIAEKHSILLIEDCAQCFAGSLEIKNPKSDIALFSFGAIKAHTCFSGAISIFKSYDLMLKVAQIQKNFPKQNNFAFIKKAIKLSLLNLLTKDKPFQGVMALFKLLKIDYDQFIVSVTRGFQGDDFFKKISHQPSEKLLKFMHYRFAAIDLTPIIFGFIRLLLKTQKK